MGKALFAAFCGTVLGAAVLIGLGMNGLDALWPAILVGIISGVCMRVLAKTPGGSYLNGALAAVSVLVAVVAGKFALLSVIREPAEAARDKAPMVAESTPEEGAEPTDPAAPVQARLPEPSSDVVDADAAAVPVPSGMEYDPTDAVFLIIGALVGYQIGKGEGGATMEEHPAEGESGGPEPTPTQNEPAAV